MPHRHMTGLKFITVSVLGYLFMLLGQHFYIYKYLIVHRQAPVEAIPSLWYFVWMLPTIIIILAVGYWSKSLSEVAIITILIGIVNSLEMYSIFLYDEPGFNKVLDGTFLDNVEGLILGRVLIIFGPIVLVFISRKLIAHFIDEIEEHVLEEF